jgi:hypothetical protein
MIASYLTLQRRKVKDLEELSVISGSFSLGRQFFVGCEYHTAAGCLCVLFLWRFLKI